MTNPMIQIDDEVREMTSAEYSELTKIQKEMNETQDSQKAARESALAKLAALGLTEKEIAAL